MGTAVLGTSAAANVVPFNSQSTDEKGSVVKTGDQPSTLSNYISATDAINKNTTTTTGIDAEFKRKYNLDDTLLLSEDEDEDASVAAANARDKSPNKRRKSMNLNAAGLSGISHGSGGGSYYVVTSSASTEASLFGSSGSETVASPSPGRYNLRHRAPASGVAGVPSPAVGVPSPLLRESVMNSAVKAQMQQLERKQVVKMDEKMNPSVKVRDGIEGVDEFKEIGHIEMPDLTDQIAALTSNVAVCEEDMAREAEENVCDDLADKVEVAAFEADVKRRRGIAMKKVGKLLAGYVAAAFLLPFFWAMGNWWVQVASVMQYCEAGVTAAPRWVDFSESFVSHRGTAIDVWGQFLPHCVVCPSGAVCEGAEVVGCMKAGEYIFGDEGFGPFGSMVGLGPACLDEMTMKSDQTGARFLEV
ncbi:hypothetical protein BC830DRAFT_752928 [Chytriomyces sp. MP71]|nr:hypothetical protein BC830DRAFT_752928 [Chytriomyces sp. MP71]